MNQLVTDQMGRSLTVPKQPKRIVSLVPSQTELLYSLGLADSVVGITKFCVHPHDWFKNKKRIGGTKKVNFKAIKALNPDLILGNKEENSVEDIKSLSEEYPVWMSDIFNLDDATQMIESIGLLTNTKLTANDIIRSINKGFSQLDQSLTDRPTVLYLIWQKPHIAVGRNTFINDMIERSGFTNYLQNPDSRYPEIDLDQLGDPKPDLVFLSSEPYPFNEEHLIELKAQLPNTTPILVDGEMFSWYGSMLTRSSEYLHNLKGTVERIRGAN